jgi:ATP/maltotriose-dependent transcriptional regulator MalT
MEEETGTLPLIRTKMWLTWLPEDSIHRPRLLDPLHAGSSGRLALISAQAGAGKSTLPLPDL